MSTETIDYRFKARGGTAANLAAVNEVPLRREMVVEIDTARAKVGDGVTPYNDLQYIGISGAVDMRVDGGYIQFFDGSGWVNLIALSELEGEQGPQGPQGPKGDPGASGIPDAPSDGLLYGRRNGAWVQIDGRAVGDVAPANTVAPVLSGSTVVGETLSVDTGAWTGQPDPAFTYQWFRDAVAIPGATGPTYQTVQDDVDTSVHAEVTATNTEGSATAASNALSIVEAAGCPPYTPPPAVGATFDVVDVEEPMAQTGNTLSICNAVTTDHYWDFVKSLQNFAVDTVDATGRVWTAEGGAAVAGGELVIDALGKSLTTASAPELSWHTQPFTLEAYIRTDAAGGDGYGRGLAIIEGVYVPGSMNWSLGLNSNRQPVFYYWGGSRVNVTGAQQFPLGEWLHFELSFDGTAIRLFVNGILQATKATLSPAPAPVAGLPLRIGASASTPFAGALRGFRVTSGVARHTSDFIPPPLPLPTSD